MKVFLIQKDNKTFYSKVCNKIRQLMSIYRFFKALKDSRFKSHSFTMSLNEVETYFAKTKTGFFCI